MLVAAALVLHKLAVVYSRRTESGCREAIVLGLLLIKSVGHGLLMIEAALYTFHLDA